MNHYQQEVAGMNEKQRHQAATHGFKTINELNESETVILGLCAAATLYEFDVHKMAQIDTLANVKESVQKAQKMDQTEQYNSGLKAFFAMNYLPTEQRDRAFTGLFASAALADVNFDEITERALAAPGPSVGPVKSVW
ncbi:MAG: hypothetical protein ACRBFS_05170 [Aureispira sp.]